MATPFFSIPSNDPNPSYSRPTTRPDPSPTPKPRGRKGGGKSQNGNKNKTPQRGVGIAELERLRHLDQQQTPPPPPPPPPPHSATTAHSRVNPFHHHGNSPLSGVPVLRYCFPGQPIPDPRVGNRFGIPELLSSELPSMPNPFHLDHHFKKKRVIGEEVVGFAKGYGGNFGGFDLKNGDNNNHCNGGFSSALSTTVTGSEVVAIHRKWTGSGNVMMEYGFFPGKSESEGNNGQQNMKFAEIFNNCNNDNNYYCYNNNNNNKIEDLSLKMGFSESSLSSPSSSSSLSSLTTATTTTTTTCNSTSVDLSLKLSSF